MTEITLGIVVASAPTLGPVFSRRRGQQPLRSPPKPSREAPILAGRSFGSIPLRPSNKVAMYNEESLLRTQTDSDFEPPAKLQDWTTESTTRLSPVYQNHSPVQDRDLGYACYTQVDGGFASQRFAGPGMNIGEAVPPGVIVRKVECDVREWQAR